MVMTVNNIYSDTPFRDEFIEGAARAFFVSAYSDYCNSGEPGSDGIPRAIDGEDWSDVAPEATPIQAYVLAGEMWAAIEHTNGQSLYQLARLAELADHDDIDPEEFGHSLAMQYMGHGVSWFDNHPRFNIEIPYDEISWLSFDPEAFTR